MYNRPTVTGASQGFGAGITKGFVATLHPVLRIADVQRLTEAGQVTGQVLHVDGSAHVGKW
jgi:NADP-dependent 3-hydroxy acid dehydrogenase YdfG